MLGVRVIFDKLREYLPLSKPPAPRGFEMVSSIVRIH
jgi:hypothetical protein